MVARSQREGGLIAARIMLLILACTLAVAAAAPTTYNQRQEGEFNVRADVQNIVFLVAVPQKLFPADVLDGLIKSTKHISRENAQERADIHVMEAFVEPSTPYQVEIGEGGASDRSVVSDVRAEEVIIAGRRRADVDLQPEQDEYKVAEVTTEQCGPDSVRDPVTLICKRADPVPKKEEAPKPTPEVIPVS